MSCKHGNWEPCEECEAEDAIYKSGFSEGAASVMKEIREKGTVVEAFLQQELDNVHVIKAEVLQAQEPSPASDQTIRYATDLAIYLAKKFYPDVTQWRPLDDLVGVLTQIDNMVAGVAVDRDALQAKVAEQSAEIERLTEQVRYRAKSHEINCGLIAEKTATIAQQAERIAEQAAMIEKCEKAISIAAHSRIAILRNSDPSNEGYPYRTDDEVAKIDGYTSSLIEALAAIAANKS